jgi:argininosuccinate synthase
MKERVLLAYSGTLASSAAAAWLAERRGAEVVTVTLDVGQTDDLDEVRARALTCGAVRAHVIDARDGFARDYVIPALRDDAARSLATLAHPLIARTLVDIAAIEAIDVVAHASSGSTIDVEVAAIDPALRLVTPAREWALGDVDLAQYARARRLPSGPPREPHLLIRPSIDPARAADAEAMLAIAFEGGIPVSVNGVSMALQELIESLSLIGGQQGVGHGDAMPAPAAVILRAAYAAAGGANGTASLKLQHGACAVVTARRPELVNHP